VAKAVLLQDRLSRGEEGGIWDALLHWVQANRVAIGSVVSLVVVLASGALYSRYQKAAAVENLRRGIATLQGGDAQKALEDLQKVRNSSVSNAEQALGLFYLGEAYATLGKKDDALKGYEDGLVVLGRGSPGTYIEQLLLVKSAQLAEGNGADALARQKYERAAEIDGPLKTEALVAAARLAEKLNDSAAAKAYYEKLSSISPAHPLAELFQGKVGK